MLTKDGSCLKFHGNVINEITGPICRGPLKKSDMEFLLSLSADKLADSIPESSGVINIDTFGI